MFLGTPAESAETRYDAFVHMDPVLIHTIFQNKTMADMFLRTDFN